MSESEHNFSDSSESTIENMPFSSIIQILKSAAKETIESKDYLSYSTIIDVYMGEPEKYSNSERDDLLKTLLNILQENKELTYEIGWDLPSVLLNYISLDLDFSLPLKNILNVYNVMKIFECLALNGNHKELFLKACELLSALKFDASKPRIEIVANEKAFDIKIHLLLELIQNNLKNIKTLYPSRFLSMCITSYINMIYINFVRNSNFTDAMFIMRRIYMFTRTYTSLHPSLPDDIDREDESIKQIIADEEHLQRKLLTAFLTNASDLLNRRVSLPLSLHFFSSFSNKPIDLDDTHALVVYDKLVELSLSFDVNLTKGFQDMVTSSHMLFHKFDYANGQEDNLVGDIFESVIIDYQQNIFTSLLSSGGEITDSKLGYLAFHCYYIYKGGNDLSKIRITFNDALVLTLRLLIPGMVQNSFFHKTCQDVAIYWSWFAIQKSLSEGKKLELEFSTIPKVLLTIYFQILLFICTSNPSQEYKDFRFCTLTLLTRVLTLSPEQISYDFIKDCLFNCPFINVKAALIGVFKELLTKDKVNEDEISDQLNSVNISSEDTGKPALPKRDARKSVKFLTLTNSRFDDIIDLISKSIDDCFVKVDPLENSETETETESDVQFRINTNQVSTLSAYLNLLVVIKKNDVVISHQDKLDEIVSKAEVIFSKCKKQFNKSKSMEPNILEMLLLTVDRIKS